MAEVSVDGWLDAAEESLREVAATALGYGDASVATRGVSAPAGLAGAYIQLLSEREAVLVGLCAEPAALSRLSGALLGLGADALLAADVIDAVGEVVNMLAGGVKRRRAAASPGLQLGLPVFVHGHLEPRERQRLHVGALHLAPDVPVHVVVLHEPRR